MNIKVEIPPEPVWRTIQSSNGMITYNAFWLQSNALRWHYLVDESEVTLNYLSLDAMPIAESAIVECEYDGKHYKGVVYEVSE